MNNERAFIARVEAANTDELIQILSRPSPEEERLLRLHLGAERYGRLRGLALRSGGRRGLKQGNIVVLHGIMGGELTVNVDGKSQYVWMSFPRLVFGAAGWLRMSGLDKSLYDVEATGILKKWYAEMLLGLAQDWNVQAFWYDWRRDLRESADVLHERINAWFGADAPVHLVGHSMGGLVARTFILQHADRWKRAWDTKGKGRAGGRLVMLGTPNHGSFAIPQICTGVESSVRKLIIADLKHNASELVGIVNTFPGSYQMLPSPAVLPKMEPLYHAGTYGAFGVLQALLDNARDHHKRLLPVVDGERMIYVAGYNRRTFNGIRDMSALATIDTYSTTLEGDGTVPHQLGFLEQNGRRIPTYFADASHGDLPNDASVIGATRQILETGTCAFLTQTVPAARGRAAEAAPSFRGAQEDARLKEITEKTRLRTRGRPAEDAPVTPEEKEAEELILRGFLGGTPADAAGPAAEVVPDEEPPPAPRKGRKKVPAAPESPAPMARAVIEIGLVKGSIETVAAKSTAGDPVDAVAVGHYLGVKPQAAEEALDRAVSAAWYKSGSPGREALPETELILTMFTERGIVRGDLAQPFMLPDPRDPSRIVVLAGMGVPGHFGVPELTVLAHELCWSLGRLQRRHLATVLIGAGVGNIAVTDAIGAWLRGIRRALSDSSEDAGHLVRRITFVERDARTLRLIDHALTTACERPDPMLKIHYRGPNEADLAEAWTEARADAIKKAKAEFNRTADQDHYDETVPVRITIGLEQKVYSFAALTESASVPQRDIPLDPRLVNESNDELAAAAAPTDQRQWGRFLERLLIPEDIRQTLYTPSPIVLVLNATTARVHWEMVARSDTTHPVVDGEAFNPDDFLGTSYGLTRQLLTTFAPATEPPPPPQRPRNVLIKAAPAEDAPLPGAQSEGEEVAATFEQFNEKYATAERRVEVERLFGPSQARRSIVMKRLTEERFDVLHFAGHCVYDEDNPANSGWLFSLKEDERLTANELRRIDRVPKFIFSNACESGITPDRSEQRNAALAPSFAEAFFSRGVANFVCTAWPVDDGAAREFAHRFYGELLGLWSEDRFACLHEAMRAARRAIATDPAGARTWGAYQHYGNPYFRFFLDTEASPKTKHVAPAPAPAKPRRRKGKSA